LTVVWGYHGIRFDNGIERINKQRRSRKRSKLFVRVNARDKRQESKCIYKFWSWKSDLYKL